MTPGPASPTQSTLIVSATSVPLGYSTTVILTERDAVGNLEISGGDSVVFELGSGSASGTFGAVSDNKNGTYRATFTGTTLGTNTITASINSQAISTTAPTITVTPGLASLTQSTVSVTSTSVAIGGTTAVTLTTYDDSGRQESNNSLNVVFGLGTGSASGTFSPVTNNHNGTYTATFTGTTIGSNTIRAAINNQAVTSTAPAITVTPLVFTITSGDGQSAVVNRGFANPLVVTLTSGGNPVSGAMISFSGPFSGPGAYPLTAGPVTTNARKARQASTSRPTPLPGRTRSKCQSTFPASPPPTSRSTSLASVLSPPHQAALRWAVLPSSIFQAHLLPSWLTMSDYRAPW